MDPLLQVSATTATRFPAGWKTGKGRGRLFVFFVRRGGRCDRWRLPRPDGGDLRFGVREHLGVVGSCVINAVVQTGRGFAPADQGAVAVTEPPERVAEVVDDHRIVALGGRVGQKDRQGPRGPRQPESSPLVIPLLVEDPSEAVQIGAVVGIFADGKANEFFGPIEILTGVGQRVPEIVAGADVGLRCFRCGLKNLIELSPGRLRLAVELIPTGQ